MAIKQTSQEALAQLKSHEGEPVKQYIELDLQNRPYRVFTTHFLAKDGEPCLVVLYEYATATSNIVIKRNEYIGEWDSTLMNASDISVPEDLKK